MMDLTTALTGMLPFIVLVSALLSAMLSLVLLRVYRQAVIRAMNKGSDAKNIVASSRPSGNAVKPQPLDILTLSCMESLPDVVDSVYRDISHSLLRLGAVYLLAGLVYAVIISLPWMITADDGFPLMRLFWLVICYAWPAVLSLLLVATVSRRQQALVVGVYALLLFLAAALAVNRNPELSIGQLIYFWLFANAAGTMLLAGFLTRRIRAVGSLVLAFVVFGVTGAMLVVTLTGINDGILWSIAGISDLLGLGANALFVLLHLLGFLIFSALGWWLLSLLGRAYRAKRMSDQSIMLDAMWLLFAVLQSFTLAFEGWGWIFTGLVAFTAYKLITLTGFSRANSKWSEADKVYSILLLRVFSLGRRSERLLDRFAQRWLRIGDINLIAGPDLATSTVEPHEFLDFVGGKLSRQFIESETELRQRLTERDRQYDPDGRYRVNEFFCRRHTWQPTMRQLVGESRAVLMDLRGFSAANQGCIWELEQLLAEVSISNVILVVDETTDHVFLKDKIQEIWSGVPVDSVNRTNHGTKLNLFELSATASQQVDDLVCQTIMACLQKSAS